MMRVVHTCGKPIYLPGCICIFEPQRHTGRDANASVSYEELVGSLTRGYSVDLASCVRLAHAPKTATTAELWHAGYESPIEVLANLLPDVVHATQFVAAF